MTLKKTTIPQLPIATTYSGGHLLYQQGSATKRIADTTVINAIENRDLNPIEVTYDQLEVLVLASALISGAKYLITDATTANIPLIVEAVAINKIGTDAKSPDFPQDVIQYDFTTGTRGTIQWRWDTLNDISVAQDLRNLQGLIIGTGGRNIHCGYGTQGSIGNNNINIRVGSQLSDESSLIGLIDNSFNVTVGYGASFINSGTTSNITVLDSVAVTADGSLSNVIFKTSINVDTSPQKTVIYANAGEIWLENNDGNQKFLYITGSTLNILDVTT